MKSPAPFPSSKLQKPGGEVPTLTALCPAMCRDGKGSAWQSSPQDGSLKAIVSLPGGWQDREEGWGGGLGKEGPCTAVYIQGHSLSGTHCGHLCVCEPPLPHALHDL